MIAAKISSHDDERGVPAFDKTLTPYLEIEGIEASALVSTDGLLVAWTGERRRMDPEVIAANAASALSLLSALAGKLGARLPGAVSLGLPGRDLILASLTEDLLLVLVGRADVIRALVHGVAL